MWRFIFKTCGHFSCRACLGFMTTIPIYEEWLSKARVKAKESMNCPTIRFDSVTPYEGPSDAAA